MPIKPQHTLIRSSFGQHYQLLTQAFETPIKNAVRVSFFCPVLTQTTLRLLNLSKNSWQGIASPYHVDVYGLNEHELMRKVAELFVRGDVALYELPRLEQKAVIDNTGNAYAFIAGDEDYAATDLNPKFIPNKAEAQKLITNIKAKELYWHNTLTEQDLLKPEIKTDKMSLKDWHELVCELIVSGKLLVYQTKDASRTPKPKEMLEDTTDVAGNRKAPLAPPTEAVPKGPAREVDADKVKTEQEEACAELDKCEVDDDEAAEKGGIKDDHLTAMKDVCEDEGKTISVRDTNPDSMNHDDLEAKDPSVEEKTFAYDSLPDSHKGLAGKVSRLKSSEMPPPPNKPGGRLLEGDELRTFLTKDGKELTGDYDLHDMIDAKTGKRIVGETDPDYDLRKKLNKAIGDPERIKHGDQANYLNYCKKEKKTPKPELLQPDPPITVIDGNKPVTVYRIENDEQLLNFYNCNETEIPESWDFERKKKA